MKDVEVNENKFCTCKSYCRIVHQKHNYKRSSCQDLLNKFKALENSYCCNNCDNTFKNVDCLKLHMKSNHVEVSIREELKVGVIVKNPSVSSGGRLLEL